MSYSHADGQEIASAIAQALSRHSSGSLFPWIDHELRKGEVFDDSIRNAIGDADLALCVVTTGFNSSDYIQTVELPALMKRHRSKLDSLIVIPVMAGGSLTGGLEDLHAGDLAEVLSGTTASPDGRAYKKLADDVSHLVGERALGGARKAMSPAQRTRKIKAFVDACSSWDSEDEHYQDFWRELMGVLGYAKPSMLQFQRKVRTEDGAVKRLDCYVPGRFVGESKSRSVRSLDAAEEQALDYVRLVGDFTPVVVCSNYDLIRISTLDENQMLTATVEVPIGDTSEWLPIVEALFADDAVSSVRRAVANAEPELANKTHIRLITNFRDILVDEGMESKQAFALTMRVLFLLVADDLGLLNVNPSNRSTGRFDSFLRNLSDPQAATNALMGLFTRLNDPGEFARKDGFPYVNGGLFGESMAFPDLTGRALEALQVASRANWSGLDPFLFGSLYQQTHTRAERAEHGQHFTSAINIRKALDPLFLDQFRARLDDARGKRERLVALQSDLVSTRVLDPAAGCGNFLLIAYQDMKAIERDVIDELIATGLQPYSTMIPTTEGEHAGQATLSLRPTGSGLKGKAAEDVVVPLVQMSHYAGIEIDPDAAALARTVLILAAVQAETALGETTDLTRTPLPLSEDTNATVHACNALTFDWAEAWVNYTGGFSEHTFIVGNPPFLGHKERSVGQREDHTRIWQGVTNSGGLDFVSDWFLLSGRFLTGTRGRAALVSTNSISQGEQPAVLWGALESLGITIDFAYRTFSWSNGAGQQAAVHNVIIGFSCEGAYKGPKFLWMESGERISASIINKYLVDTPDVRLKSRRTPISLDMPTMSFGSMPNDGGHLTKVTAQDAEGMRLTDPTAAKYLRPLIGADELIGSKARWCLWLKELDPQDLRASREIRDRTADVRAGREASPRAATRKLASTPHLFGEDRQPTTPYLAVPRVSSESRAYIPMAFFSPDVIASDALLTISDADVFLFGVMSSRVFSIWNSTVSGRLRSDCRVSAEVTYNNFPFPDVPDQEHFAITAAAQAVLDARAAHPDASLAHLYNPETFYLYTDLKAAHDSLDTAVLAAYGLQASASDGDILRVLFARYTDLASAEETS